MDFIRSIALFLAGLLMQFAGSPATTTPTPLPILPTTTVAALPTAFALPQTGDLMLSYDTYDSQFNSLGGILTIRRLGGAYAQTMVYSDGSCGTVQLSEMAGQDGLALEESDGSAYGDHIVINADGSLTFADSQGPIYTVAQVFGLPQQQTTCERPLPQAGKALEVHMQLVGYGSNTPGTMTVEVSTNLPPGTMLFTEVWDAAGSRGQNTRYVDAAGNITELVDPSHPGIFSITVSSPSASQQPDDVLQVFGERGCNLTGEWVQYDAERGTNLINFYAEFMGK